MTLIRSRRPSSIRSRLTATYLVLILLPFALLAAVMLRQLDRFYLTRLEEDMTVEAGLVADSVADDMAAGRLIDSAALIRRPPPLFPSAARISSTTRPASSSAPPIPPLPASWARARRNPA